MTILSSVFRESSGLISSIKASSTGVLLAILFSLFIFVLLKGKVTFDVFVITGPMKVALLETLVDFFGDRYHQFRMMFQIRVVLPGRDFFWPAAAKNYEITAKSYAI